MSFRPPRLLRRTVVALAAAILFAATVAATGPAEAMLTGARCEATVRNQVLESDGDLAAAMPDPPGPTGLRSARVPTGVMGLWLRVVEESRHEMALERITATRVERLRFDEACAATEYVVGTQVPPPGALTDKLIARVARGEHAVSWWIPGHWHRRDRPGRQPLST